MIIIFLASSLQKVQYEFFEKKAAANNNSNKLSLCYAKYKKELLILLLCLKNGGPLYK
jgi:hypothetical protein